MTIAKRLVVELIVAFPIWLVILCLPTASSSFTSLPSTKKGASFYRPLATDDNNMSEQLVNSAFVFVKPHANNPQVQGLVREMLASKSITIKSEGDISGEIIDKGKLIDQHYYAIASKATLLDPKDMAVPADKFKDFFGESWDDVIAQGRAANAMQACEIFGVDANGLEAAWRECEPKNKVIKFGGGFYCGLVEVEGKEPLYVFNAFFMSMRSKFTGDASIHYYEVEWNASDLSWADFRGKVLGPTDPSSAPEGAIRKVISNQWKELGLVAAPNKGDNGVHASASPFEGLSEKRNWMGKGIKSDTFGSAMLSAGISEDTIKAWSVDPRVNLPGDEGVGSIFDALEDLDAKNCLEKLIAINAASS